MPAYTPSAVLFDGTNDYMTRGAGLTGAADSKKGTVSFWIQDIEKSAGSGAPVIVGVTTLGGATSRMRVNSGVDEKIQITAHNAAGTVILNITSSVIFSSYKRWRHVCASWDLETAGARHLYVDGVSDITVTTFTNDTIDYTLADWGIGAFPDGTLKLNGDLSQVYFQPGEYVDLSNAANLAKFITTDNRPVDFGSNGSTPTGTQPLVFQNIVPSDSASAFATNLGSGGNFSITGSLTISSSFPYMRFFDSASTPADPGTGTADPTAVTPPTGMLAGDLVFLIADSRIASLTQAISEAGGQTWTSHAQQSATTKSVRVFTCTFNGTWSANPSVSFGSTICNSAYMHVFRPPATDYTWSVNVAQTSTNDTTSPFSALAGHTTTGTDPTVTLQGWHSPDDNTWGTLTGTNWEVPGTAQYRNTSGSDQSGSFAYIVSTSAQTLATAGKSQLTLGADNTQMWEITMAAVAPVVVNPVFRPTMSLQAVNRASRY